MTGNATDDRFQLYNNMGNTSATIIFCIGLLSLSNKRVFKYAHTQSESDDMIFSFPGKCSTGNELASVTNKTHSNAFGLLRERLYACSTQAFTIYLIRSLPTPSPGMIRETESYKCLVRRSSFTLITRCNLSACSG